jgi:hypothetical protein
MFRITDEDSPVFVELIADGLVRKLALPPHEERALVVGSTAGAALQVTGMGVAPVQFHLERHQGAVWLVPAYKIGDLRLNGTPVDAAAPLEEHNVITFARVHLEVTIREAEAFVTGEGSLLDDQRGNGRRSVLNGVRDHFLEIGRQRGRLRVCRYRRRAGHDCRRARAARRVNQSVGALA